MPISNILGSPEAIAKARYVSCVLQAPICKNKHRFTAAQFRYLFLQLACFVLRNMTQWAFAIASGDLPARHYVNSDCMGIDNDVLSINT